MTDLPVPRYKIGDLVYRASTTRTMAQHPCPDCLGIRTWKVISPAGFESTLDCPRCKNGFVNISGYRKIPSLTYQKVVPHVDVLTVGQINASTAAQYGSQDHVSYMCDETGIGSGSVYGESMLHPTIELARASAEALAEAEQKNVDEQPQALEGVHFAGLTIDLASHGVNWSSIYGAWEKAQAYRELLTTIQEKKPWSPDDIDAVFENDHYCEKHPLEDLIAAVSKLDWNAAAIAFKALPRPLPPGIEELPLYYVTGSVVAGDKSISDLLVFDASAPAGEPVKLPEGTTFEDFFKEKDQ